MTAIRRRQDALAIHIVYHGAPWCNMASKQDLELTLWPENVTCGRCRRMLMHKNLIEIGGKNGRVATPTRRNPRKERP
jgi:hypothetical protein